MRRIVRSDYSRRFIRPLWMTALFNSAIALFLHQLQTGGDFGVTFLFSQTIGLSICLCVMAGRVFFKPVGLFPLVAVTAVGVIIGAFGGTLLGMLLTGFWPDNLQSWRSIRFYPIILIAILFGGIISYFFISQQRISEERYKRLEIEKQNVEAHLKLLQAQIEPHFLFNSLSTVLSLMDGDLAEGRRMLENLIRFLRTSLTRARADGGTLGQELEMIGAYLEVYQVRMGSRLTFQTEVADDLQSFPLPPMLLQPLVENAILHGLEPLAEGGEVCIEAEEVDGFLRLGVTDTGVGISATGGEGVGLSNVRERLLVFYDQRARISFRENSPRGLQVIMEIPRDAANGDHRG
jgi:signal transduction histidine kinase